MQICINTDAGVAEATKKKTVVWGMNVPQMREGTWAGAQCWSCDGEGGTGLECKGLV